MITVNATLIVQAINFFIAYILFRFILLKPAYHVITTEEQSKTELQELVSQDEAVLGQKRNEQHAQWLACQAYCKDFIPELPDKAELFRGIAPKIALAPLSSHEIDEIADRIAQAVVLSIGGRRDRD